MKEGMRGHRSGCKRWEGHARDIMRRGRHPRLLRALVKRNPLLLNCVKTLILAEQSQSLLSRNLLEMSLRTRFTCSQRSSGMSNCSIASRVRPWLIFCFLESKDAQSARVV
jgi:hypothetical protein